MDWIQRAEFKRKFYRDTFLCLGAAVVLIIVGIYLTHLIFDWVNLMVI